MKSKIQNGVKFLKRFFEPALLDKFSAAKVLAHGVVESLLVVTLPMVVIPKVITLMTLGNSAEARVWAVGGFLGFVILFYLRSFVMYYWFWTMDIPLSAVLYKKYIPKVLETDSSVFDKKGTGYHLSKFQTGVKALSNTVRELLENVPSVFINSVIGIVLTFSLGFVYGIALTIFLISAVYFIGKFYIGEVELLEESENLRNRVGGDIARQIMSKQEVIFSDKISHETEVVLDKVSSMFVIEKAALWYSNKRMSPIWMMPTFAVLLLVFLQTFGFTDFSVGQMSLIVILSATFSNLIGDMFKVIGRVFENYNSIENFWEMVDGPSMVGYNEGEKFEHRGGEIELKNVTFGYESK